MNIKRNVALGLSALWFMLALLTDDDIGVAMMLVVSNIWLAAALLAGDRK